MNPGIDTAALTQMLGISMSTFAIILGAVAVWEVIWKGFGLWKSGRQGHKWWFIAILVLNTLGIVPIIYLLFFTRDEDEGAETSAPSSGSAE